MSLFSHFKDIDDITISNFISSTPVKFSETIDKLSTSNNRLVNSQVLDNRSKLQIPIKNFHQMADTLTQSVVNSIKLLDDPKTMLFISTHQPNLFAYGGIFRKILLNQALKSELELKYGRYEKKIINLFVVIDHDFMDEVWIRRAQLPSLHHSQGILTLKHPVNKSNRWFIVNNIPLPSIQLLNYWEGQIYSWITNISKTHIHVIDHSILLNNFKMFWKEVEQIYSKAKTYSDFNSFLISHIVNKTWNYDTLFVRLSNLNPVFEDGYRYLISNFNLYYESLKNAENLFKNKDQKKERVQSNWHNYSPFWIHCNRCGGKASSILHNKKDHEDFQLLSGTCLSCKSSLKIDIENEKGNNKTIKSEFNNISPKAIPIILLLSKCLDTSCYVSGAGAINYMLPASLVFKKLNIDMPTVLFWPAKDICHGIAQLEALEYLRIKKHSEIEDYLESLKKKEFEYKEKIISSIEKRKNLVESGESIDNHLIELFALKQSQRKIRQKIKIGQKANNTLNIMPCIIDYALNFGLVNTELQWRQNLLKNDRFDTPLTLS